MKVEIWSDVVCPWCHIGKRRFEAALTRFSERYQVEVEWKSFELDPGSRSSAEDDRVAETDYADRLASKYGTTRGGAQKMLDSMTAAAAGEGLDFRFDRAPQANTFDAHQVIHLARERGLQDPVKECLLQAYFHRGEAVGDPAVLARLGAEAGLDAGEVQQALTEQRFASAVRGHESEANALGISGVPFFVVDRKYGLSGAQPPEQLLHALQRAWAESHPITFVGAEGDGSACGPDGCAT